MPLSLVPTSAVVLRGFWLTGRVFCAANSNRWRTVYVSASFDTEAILLVNLSGRDSPGMMADLNRRLASRDVVILDIGQAVIHAELTLGLLLSFAPAHMASIRAELASYAAQHGVSLRMTDVSAADYAAWVGRQGSDRRILTVVSAGVSSAQFAAVAQVVTNAGLNIDDIVRLSGRAPLETLARSPRTCVQLSLRGTVANERSLQKALQDVGRDLGFDFSLQVDSVYRRNRRLVAFDMDSTLIDAEVIDELAKHHGVGGEVSAITERAMAGELDFQQSFRARAALLKGLSATALEQVAKDVQLNDGADRLIASLKHFGYKTAIISGGIHKVGAALASQLGIDYVYANELEVADGVLTGEVVGEIVDAERKATLLREICESEGIALRQAIAIGDGANDLPMLASAGLGVAFRAKPLVQASAQHAISNFGLDSVLYLMGFSDSDIAEVYSSPAKS